MFREHLSDVLRFALRANRAAHAVALVQERLYDPHRDESIGTRDEHFALLDCNHCFCVPTSDGYETVWERVGWQNERVLG